MAVNSDPHAPGNALSSAVHEIKNPLESLLSLLYLMEGDPGLSPTTRGYLKTAQGEVGRIAQIAHSAMQQFRNREVLVGTDVSDLLASVLKFYEPKLRTGHISVSTRSCADAKINIFPNLMREVLSNLILNAIAAMPNGGTVWTRVTFAREPTGECRSGMRITIADNGIGISPEDLSRVREPFFTTKGADGSGMGLAVVQEIISRHSGTLKIHSSVVPGHTGSVFSIFIPKT